MIGESLGHYRVVALLGVGGMGEVYSAEDTKLKRQVALKVLRPELAESQERLERFQREAETLASLDHPNIVTIYSVERSDGVPFLTMQLVEGKSLSELIPTKGMPLDRALEIAISMASALAASHARGIVHRDLKPGNVMVTESGQVKVLDFGLAKLRPEMVESIDSQETTDELTVEGRILGTVRYMSPEQLEGKEVDSRSDIFAFGIILQEMLTGRRPFAGSNLATLAASVLEGNALPVSSLNSAIPTGLIHTVERCLAIDPSERWQSALDLAAELRWVRDSGAEPATQEGARAPTSRRRIAVWALIGALAIPAGFLLTKAWTSSDDLKSEQVVAFDLNPPPGISFAEGVDSSAVVSPQGDSVVVVGTDRDGSISLWTKSLDGADPRKIVDGGVGQPFWSPDGKMVGFFHGRQLKMVSLAGGPPRPLAPVSMEYRGGSWGVDGIILFAPGPHSGLSRVSLMTGDVVSLTTPDHSRGEIGHLWPHFLPDGEHFLYFLASSEDAVQGVYVASLDEPHGRRVLDTSASAVYGNGFLLHVRDTHLMARPFDLDGLRFTGDPVAIAEGVASFFTFQGVISASSTGVLVYSREDITESTQLRWVDSTGESLETAGLPRDQRNPILSRDGRYLAVESYQGTDSDIVVLELETGRQQRIRDPATQAMYPVLSPDGASLVFAVARSGGADIFRMETKSFDPPRVVLRSDPGVMQLMPTDWSPDGRQIMVAERTSRGDYDLAVVPVEGSGQPEKLLGGPNHEISGRFSPSGRYFSYASDESGKVEVYIEPYPRSGLKCQVSAHGGQDPHWGWTDDQIYYLSPSANLMQVTVENAQSCDLTRPLQMFAASVKPPSTSRNHYAVDPHSDRYLLNSTLENQGVGEIAVIVNWPAVARRGGV